MSWSDFFQVWKFGVLTLNTGESFTGRFIDEESLVKSMDGTSIEKGAIKSLIFCRPQDAYTWMPQETIEVTPEVTPEVIPEVIPEKLPELKLPECQVWTAGTTAAILKESLAVGADANGMPWFVIRFGRGRGHKTFEIPATDIPDLVEAMEDLYDLRHKNSTTSAGTFSRTVSFEGEYCTFFLADYKYRASIKACERHEVAYALKSEGARVLSGTDPNKFSIPEVQKQIFQDIKREVLERLCN